MTDERLARDGISWPVLQRIHRAVLLLAFCQAVGCGGQPGQDTTPTRSPEAAARRDYSNAVERVEAPLEASLERFQAAARKSDDLALREEAGKILAQAREAREVLEILRVAGPLASARGEELIFLNHLVLGFQRYLETGRGSAPLEELTSILRRGRAHQKRGREAILGKRSSRERLRDSRDRHAADGRTWESAFLPGARETKDARKESGARTKPRSRFGIEPSSPGEG